MTKLSHQPVLVNQVMDSLDLKPGESYLDLTAGYGGHAVAALARVGEAKRLCLVDRDSEATQALKQRLPRAEIWHSDFVSAADKLAEEGRQFDALLLDLGVSSAQLDNPLRGFSLKQSGPLDMRMDQSQKLAASEIVNTWSQDRLADLLYNFGQERRSRQIAKLIVTNRPINNTAELAAVISKAFPKYSRIHPATRSFQALRIAVNDELGQLGRALEILPKLLKPGGRLAIISFHSLEDGLVKAWLKSQPELAVLNKKVIKGSDFDSSNRRARSAKLRAAVKLKN